ncbi:phosphatidylserine decarboxylase family protein [Enemella dayhoffiae]|uniref:Phosphatidylserine decarboxylase family protein n=1 Tax=Enemella dayhoffiae TaxID=2016507 RepID=A0A255GS58_9ACTN|nr:phosphatidylserine decarboxylase [Enemella dayhoffiae]OYO17243.1 phosphatidylserine decarboxylase family protein [Enemella dayhoffiae]
MGHARLFLQHSLANYASVASVLPTSAPASRSMAAELIRRGGAPTRILEVGPGVGPITAQVVRAMGPEDRLTCVELIPEYADVLRERFRTEPDFRAVADRCEVITGDVRDLAKEHAEFDVAIVSVPFNTLGEEVTQQIFEVVRRVLRPGGTCTYIEYAWLRTLRDAFTGLVGRGGGHSAFLDEQLRRYRYRTDLVLGNVPPSWAHHLRFTEVADEEAEQVVAAPVPTTSRLWPGMGIDRDGIAVAAGAGVLAGVTALATRRATGAARRLWLLPALAGVAGAAFFRDPVRQIPADPDAVVSSVDGKVLKVERLESDEHLGPGPWLRIATFLSIFSVHINRAPVAGRVVEVIDRNEGGYAAAMKPAAEHNVARTVVLQTRRGRVGVTQRTGMVARRIVVRHGRGSVLAKGERYGLIRFGSRTDVYLPADAAEAVVSKGAVVRGGSTVIARWSSAG